MNVTLFRSLGQPPEDSGLSPAAQEERREAVRSTVLGVGTLACDGCDAPIAIGGRSLSLTDELSCPFCRRHGPARDFLSLSPPTRPARVVVRMSLP